MSRFVRGESVVLTLSRGDTVTVRRRLNTGEERALRERMSTIVSNGHDAVIERKIDPLKVPAAMCAAYLLDWTLTDDRGVRIMIDVDRRADLEAMLDNLDPDDFRELAAAIETHVDAQRAARELEKKTPPGGPASSATSTSPAAAAGATSG